MRSVLYADSLEVSLIDELREADTDDESNGQYDQTTQDDTDSENPLGHGLTDEHCRSQPCSRSVDQSFAAFVYSSFLLFLVIFTDNFIMLSNHRLPVLIRVSVNAIRLAELRHFKSRKCGQMYNVSHRMTLQRSLTFVCSKNIPYCHYCVCRPMCHRPYMYLWRRAAIRGYLERILAAAAAMLSAVIRSHVMNDAVDAVVSNVTLLHTFPRLWIGSPPFKIISSK